jgi:hypothetical protein
MTVETTALAWRLVAYDSRMKAAVQLGQLADVELVHELREETAMALFRAMRKNWTPALRPKYPEQAA